MNHHATVRAHNALARERGSHERHSHPDASPAPRLRQIVGAATDRFLLLPIGAAVGLGWANVAPVSYFTMTERAAFFVNEIGMAFFFALLAQEVYEAMMPGGALHSWRRWSMPIAAAAGGIVGAACVYLAYLYLAYEIPLSSAWPITCAIDLAATYYVMKTITPRSGAIPFALAVAITTDIVGMFVVAPSYTVLQTRLGGVALIVAAFGVGALMRVMKVRAFWPYLLICGSLAWFAFYWDEIHPAFSLIPIVPLLPHEPRRVNLVADPPDDDAVHHAEHEWHLLVQPIVLLFGLVNAGVLLQSYDTATWAVLTAALIGRPIGILAAVGVASALGLHLPRHVAWRELLVIAFATSSGFAVALFFASGLLAPGPALAQIKVGVLLSVVGVLFAFGAARALNVGRFAR